MGSHVSRPSSCGGGGELGEEIAGEAMVPPPRDGDGRTPGHASIADRAKKAASTLCKGGLSFSFRAHDLRRRRRRTWRKPASIACTSRTY